MRSDCSHELISLVRSDPRVLCCFCPSCLCRGTGSWAQPSPHFSHSEINAIPFNGQQAVTAITALWLWCPTAFRWLQQPIGRHLVIDVAKQVIQRHPEVKNEGIPETARSFQLSQACQLG